MTDLSRADLDALRDAAGADAVEAPTSMEVDAAKPGAVVAPNDASSLARVVGVLAERRIACAVRGGGTRAAYGNPLREIGVLLSTRRLDQVDEIDAGEGVARIAAGAPLSVVREAVAARGWTLPFDAPGAQSTLGGVLAAAAVGPRHLGWGRPRDLVLGLEVVLGDGLLTRSGGRVVKNVTGYDLMKLHVGACGAFGVIVSGWIRLRPRPEAERVLALAVPEGDGAFDRALATSRRATARACALVDTRLAAAVDPQLAPRSGWLLVVECAGDEAAVARDVASLAAEGGIENADGSALARVRSLQGETFGAAGLRFRVSCLPSRAGSVARVLHEGGAALIVQPGTGLVHARVALDAERDGGGLDRAWRAARRAAEVGGGDAVLEAAPLWARAARDVFGDTSEASRLAQVAKRRFDPHAVLNPGRLAGCL